VSAGESRQGLLLPCYGPALLHRYFIQERAYTLDEALEA
jgi:hypothetical protein